MGFGTFSPALICGDIWATPKFSGTNGKNIPDLQWYGSDYVKAIGHWESHFDISDHEHSTHYSVPTGPHPKPRSVLSDP